MSEPKFTPGPWRWDYPEETPDWGDEGPWLRAVDGSVVLEGWGYDAWGIVLPGWNFDGYRIERPDGGSVPDTPDAALIAAAPDLYAALEACAADLAELAAVFGAKGNDMSQEQSHLDEADAALAKARGGS